jgi:3-keto-5-aminohexanoate cleavage enzyme
MELKVEKLIITAAVCGSAPMREQNPNAPYSPAEIADEALRSSREGAAIAHVHVRDPQTGQPAFEQSLFAEVVDRIRSESDMLINLTTSGFNLNGPNVDDKRLLPAGLSPDLCSLDVGSLNFRGGRVFVNPPKWVERAAQEMREAKVKPEIEIFDVGHLRQALDMVHRKLFEPPPYFQVCLGVQWGIEATPEALIFLKNRVPAECQWSVLATGPAQLALTTHGMLMGAYVRVGFQDNLYLSRGVKAESNARFVERTVRLAKMLGRDVASCSEARQILGLGTY